VAVRADGPEMFDWIDFVPLANTGKWAHMVNMDEPVRDFVVCRVK
jgi:hypothetical protein